MFHATSRVLGLLRLESGFTTILFAHFMERHVQRAAPPAVEPSVRDWRPIAEMPAVQSSDRTEDSNLQVRISSRSENNRLLRTLVDGFDTDQR